MAKADTSKLAPLPVPTTPEGAFALQLKMGEYINLVEANQVRLEEVENTIADDLAQLSRLGEALHAYAQARRPNLRLDERTIVIPNGGSMGWTKSRRVVTTRTIKRIIASFKRRGLKKLIRITEALDKEAILKNPDLIKGTRGISVPSYELFSIKLLGRLSWLERDPIDKTWSIKRGEKKKAPTPLAQAAE